MTAPFLEDLPILISAEPRSIARPRPWELRLFVATCAVLLAFTFLLNHGVLSARARVSPHDAGPTPAAAGSQPMQEKSPLVVAYPATPPPSETARQPASDSIPRDPPATVTPPDEIPSKPQSSIGPAPHESTGRIPASDSANAPEALRNTSQVPPIAPAEPPASARTSEDASSTAVRAAPIPTDTPVTPPETLATSPVSAPQDAATANVPSDASAGSPPSQSGPTLYFESDIVLLSLLMRRHIEVFVRQGERWTRVTLSGATETEPLDRSLYRLRPETVPELLRRNLAPEIAPGSREWAVWLEPAIAAAVQQARTSAGFQDLVIDRSGQVQLRSRVADRPRAGVAAGGSPPG